MKLYIECYYADGSQILGNLDGQAVLRRRNYKSEAAYQNLAGIVGNPNWMNGKVAFAKIVTEDGRVLETIHAADGKRMRAKAREMFQRYQISKGIPGDC